MKTITWDKFVKLMNDVNIFVTIDKVAAQINYFPSEDSFKFRYTNKGETYHFDILRRDNENIEAEEFSANIKCVGEDGFTDNCMIQFLIPKNLFTETRKETVSVFKYGA